MWSAADIWSAAETCGNVGIWKVAGTWDTADTSYAADVWNAAVKSFSCNRGTV